MKTCKDCGETLSLERFYTNQKYIFPYCKECTKKKSKLWAQSHKEKVREYRLKEKYGLDLMDYQRLYDFVNGQCQICGDYKKVLSVDHNHETGAVRGLLCANCNHGLGKFKDKQEVLLRAAEYLRQYQEPQLEQAITGFEERITTNHG